MKLTVEQHRESIKRYDHIRPARGADVLCRRLCPGTTRTCSQEKGHRGPHVAHGLFRGVVAVWDLDGSAAAPRSPQPAGRGPRRPIGLRSRSPMGFLDAVRNIVQRGIGSLEELAWLVFFITFVGFAVGGLLLIYLG